MTQVIRVSKTGINVGTATDPDDLTYSSEYNTLKYHLGGTARLSISTVSAFGSTTARGTINHSLGYYPYFILYVRNGVSGNFNPNGITDVGSGAATYISGYIGTASLVCFLTVESFLSPLGAYTADFNYKIFRNDLNL